jgi:hypothetical protein
MTTIKLIDPSALADAQHAVIHDGAPPATLMKFEPMLAVHRKAFGPSNLSIRQHLLLGRLGAAAKDYEALIVRGVFNETWLHGPNHGARTSEDGMELTFIEGYDYFMYALEALTWAEANYGAVVQGLFPLLQQTKEYYAALQAPDGSMPYPECRSFPNTFAWKPGFYRSFHMSAPYYIASAAGDAWVCINLDTSPLSHRNNLHTKPAFGSFVVYRHGFWLKGASPYRYAGFTESELLRETTRWNTPKGAFDKDWRINPPRCRVLSIDPMRNENDEDVIRIEYVTPRRWLILPGKKIVREFHVARDGLLVSDNGEAVFHTEWRA